MDAEILTKFLFPVPTPTYHTGSFPGELVWVPVALHNPGDCTNEDNDYAFPCLLLTCGTARYIIIYFHRNAEDIGTCRRFCDCLRYELDVHVLIVEFPGYGPDPSCSPSASQAEKHARAAFAFVNRALQWPSDSIILFGSSVGTGPAVLLASQVEVAGTILVSPFLSIREVCKDTISGFLAWFFKEPFPNRERAPCIRSRTLIVHGQQDTVIPFRHGERLFDILRCKKALIGPPHLGHNGCLLQDEAHLLRPMLDFFSLPDYHFEPIRVPEWALRQPRREDLIRLFTRLCRDPLEPPPKIIGLRGVCQAYAQQAGLMPASDRVGGVSDLPTIAGVRGTIYPGEKFEEGAMMLTLRECSSSTSSSASRAPAEPMMAALFLDADTPIHRPQKPAVSVFTTGQVDVFHVQDVSPVALVPMPVPKGDDLAADSPLGCEVLEAADIAIVDLDSKEELRAATCDFNPIYRAVTAVRVSAAVEKFMEAGMVDADPTLDSEFAELVIPAAIMSGEADDEPEPFVEDVEEGVFERVPKSRHAAHAFVYPLGCVQQPTLSRMRTSTVAI